MGIRFVGRGANVSEFERFWTFGHVYTASLLILAGTCLLVLVQAARWRRFHARRMRWTRHDDRALAAFAARDEILGVCDAHRDCPTSCCNWQPCEEECDHDACIEFYEWMREDGGRA